MQINLARCLCSIVHTADGGWMSWKIAKASGTKFYCMTSKFNVKRGIEL